MKIAIIGAGFSGSYLAHKLEHLGHQVTLFEKSRGVGGRMATRHTEGLKINHGCDAFQAKTKKFQDFCLSMVQQNLLKKKEKHLYTADAMNTMLKALSKNAHIEKNSLITSIHYENEEYTLKDSNHISYKGFDFLIFTIPAEQILNIDFNMSQSLRNQLSKVNYDSVVSLVLTGDNISDLDKEQLSNVAHLKKLNTQENKAYTIQMDSAFSEKYRHLNKNAITPYIVQEIQQVIPSFKLYNYKHFTHLWKYGLTSQSLNLPYVYEAERKYAICSDWLMGNAVEDAFMSVENFIDSENIFMHLEESV